LRRRGFGLWIATFYGLWVLLVTLGGHWREVVGHWGIALAMALGSFVGSSTPMGGGTVGFPVLVLLLDEPVALGRQFSFAIQALGMGSASLYLVLSRRPVAWRLLGWALAAALFTVPPALLLLVPRLPALGVKLLFAVLWASFGMLHLGRLRELEARTGGGDHAPRVEGAAGLTVGILGGLAAAATGSGINLVLYAVMLLPFRSEMRLAISTSVIAMAATSLIGISTEALAGTLTRELYLNWLAAAPVVILGAPLGARLMHHIPRRPTLLAISFLCLAQLVWTLLHEEVTGLPLALTLLAVALSWGLVRRGGSGLIDLAKPQPPFASGRASQDRDPGPR